MEHGWFLISWYFVCQGLTEAHAISYDMSMELSLLCGMNVHASMDNRKTDDVLP